MFTGRVLSSPAGQTHSVTSYGFPMRRLEVQDETSTPREIILAPNRLNMAVRTVVPCESPYCSNVPIATGTVVLKRAQGPS